MGIITVFCPLSGCTPQMANTAFEEIFEYEETDVDPGPIVLKALETLIDDDERHGQDDVSVIGVIDENGVPMWEGRMDKAEALRIPDSSLRVIPHCKRGEFWDVGFVSPPDSRTNHNKYLVSFGTNIMVQTASLRILSIATLGRMTPERVWRLAMYQGFSVPHNGYDGFGGIDYGEMTYVRQQCPSPLPGMAIEDVAALESLGDIDLVKKAMIDEGWFWIWMQPDRFPLQATSSDHLFVPSVLDAPSPSQALSKTETIPFEVVSQIASQVSLSSFLCLLSTSRTLRSRLVGSESDRDALARTWIAINSPWYQVPKDELLNRKEDAVIGWSYLRRCFESGSMRNRRRIWGITEQVEKKNADELGI